MQDIQSGNDNRNIKINRVGIRKMCLPIVYVEGNETLPSVGRWIAETDLASDVRGTHMSRLVRFLHLQIHSLNFFQFSQLPLSMLNNLSSSEAFLSVRFTRFFEKKAPASGEIGLVDTEVAFFSKGTSNNEIRTIMQVVVPVTSLCPCSKAISQYGAHNQRSHVTISVEPKNIETMTTLELIKIAEAESSCELFSMLKRTDEKIVTERAYENPKFVEDIVRDVALALQNHDNILHFRVEAENFESIHNHSAYGVIESDGFAQALIID